MYRLLGNKGTMVMSGTSVSSSVIMSRYIIQFFSDYVRIPRSVMG